MRKQKLCYSYPPVSRMPQMRSVQCLFRSIEASARGMALLLFSFLVSKIIGRKNAVSNEDWFHKKKIESSLFR